LGLVPLKLYYHDTRHDNFTTATADGIHDAEAAGYTFVRDEGYIFTTQDPEPGLIPLKLYYHDTIHDNFTTATADGIEYARTKGYRFVRDEAYIHTSDSSL
jgi:hypothetical protein